MFDLKCSSRALDHFSFLSGVFKYSVGFLKGITIVALKGDRSNEKLKKNIL
jgi:hypothetical protein